MRRWWYLNGDDVLVWLVRVSLVVIAVCAIGALWDGGIVWLQVGGSAAIAGIFFFLYLLANI